MSANVGGQAVLEGVMMRSPGTWAVTVRRSDGGLARVCRPDLERRGAASLDAAPDHPRRRRARRVARDRLPRALGLGDVRLDPARRGGRPGGGGRAHPRPDRVRVRHRDRVCAHHLQGLARGHHGLSADPLDRPVRGRRGRDPGELPDRLPGAHLARARPAPRLPVPRRRAQGDQRLRGRRRAHARARPVVLQDPRPLRDGVPALGDGHRDLRVRARRPARLAGA